MENEILKEIIKWIVNNKEWLFSGLGIIILGGVVKKFFFKNEPTLIHKQNVSENGMAVQAGRDVIIGIDEKRAREINAESLAIAKKDFSYEAEQKVADRVQKLEDRVMPRLYRIEGALQNFADPSFQVFLTKANKAAACTDRESDYDLLSELLIHRIEKKDSRKDQIGLNKAVEIVDQITDEALSGLTIFFAVSQYSPVAGFLDQGLSILDNLYNKLPLTNLPVSKDWLEELDVLDAVRVSSMGTLKKLEQYWSEKFTGFVTAGIKKNGDKWNDISNMLNNCGLSANFLITNTLLDDYVLIPVVDENAIDSFVQTRIVVPEGRMDFCPFSDEQKQVLHQIFSMYDKSPDLLNKVKNAFVEKLDSFEAIKTVRLWWNSIPHAITVTAVGRVLAHANAKRCDPSIPNLN
ncbi:LPO_1073/Vpar_1526 family protein [Fibrobacter intestinalis]|nr:MULTISPECIES: LPO_1073/Vpar_1526 family protein [Fibrobacter]